jgi:hypothetical protein
VFQLKSDSVCLRTMEGSVATAFFEGGARWQGLAVVSVDELFHDGAFEGAVHERKGGLGKLDLVQGLLLLEFAVPQLMVQGQFGLIVRTAENPVPAFGR